MQPTRIGKTTVERVAKPAMRLGGRQLAEYASARSRHDFTQRQLIGCLILRAYLNTAYRGLLEQLPVKPKKRRCLRSSMPMLVMMRSGCKVNADSIGELKA